MATSSAPHTNGRSGARVGQSEFVLADGTTISHADPDFDPPAGTVEIRTAKLSRLDLGEQFAYTTPPTVGTCRRSWMGGGGEASTAHDASGCLGWSDGSWPLVTVTLAMPWYVHPKILGSPLA